MKLGERKKMGLEEEYREEENEKGQRRGQDYRGLRLEVTRCGGFSCWF